MQQARNEAARRTSRARWPCAEAAPVEEVLAAEPVVCSDVVLNFQFGRSELTDEAKRKLASAIVTPKPNARLSVALEGHADWTGPEAYNEQLGLDRAESRAAVPGGTAPDSGRTDQRGQLRRGQPGGPEHDAEKVAPSNRRVVIKGGA